MKKALIVIVIILSSVSLYSAEPVVKFYLQDGSSKQYNLSDIETMKFSSAPDTLQIHIFKNDGKSLYYPAQLIDSIKFAVDTTHENRLHLWHDGFIWDVAIHEIDSILLYYTTYTAVTIGEQHWMYKNLNVDHYRNGDSIPEVDSDSWAHMKAGAWCYFRKNYGNKIFYGKLYNWFAVNDSSGLAPEGWHIPSDSEWTGSPDHLNVLDISGNLKETGTSHWLSPNYGATNETGFTALPGGYRYDFGTFSNIGQNGCWWSSTEYYTSAAMCLELNYNHSYHHGFSRDKNEGLSVRCIKD